MAFFLNVAKIQVFNCQPSSFSLEDLGWQLDNFCSRFFLGLWSGDLIYQLGIHLTPFTFHTCEMQSSLVLSFSKIYIMLYVVFNLLIWFWERCIEIYFRTCAGSPQAFRFTSYFPVLICVNITQDLGKTWPYFKIYSKNIWSKKYEEIWKIWRRWNMYDKIRRRGEWYLRYYGDHTWMESSDWVTYEDFLDCLLKFDDLQNLL